MRSLGSLKHPTSKWPLGEIEKGNGVVMGITPKYYSTWNYGKTKLLFLQLLTDSKHVI
jgi:hypothetical protein